MYLASLPSFHHLAKTSQHTLPAQRSCLQRLLSVQQTWRPHREGWDAAGTLWELLEFPGSGVPVSATIYISLHLGRAGRSSVQVLWPTCKFATPPKPILAPNKRSRQDQWHFYTYLSFHPRATTAWQASTLDTGSVPISLPKPSSTYSLHRGHFSARPLILSNSYKQAQKVKQKEKTEAYLSNKGQQQQIPRKKALMKGDK